MKVLTLTQPWATLVAIGAKHIETRSWATSYRGPLAIRAAKGASSIGWPQINHICRHTEPFKSVLQLDRHPAEALPIGAIVAVCELKGCIRIEEGLLSYQNPGVGWWIITEQERAFGDYTPGRYAWLLADIRALPDPIPAKGKLGLWNYEGEL